MHSAVIEIELETIVSSLDNSLRPLRVLFSIIGVDLVVKTRCMCFRFVSHSYTIMCILINVISNAFWIPSMMQSGEALGIKERLDNFMYINYGIQMIGCHCSLILIARYHWAHFYDSLIKIESLIGPDSKFCSNLKKTSLLAVVTILLVSFSPSARESHLIFKRK